MPKETSGFDSFARRWHPNGIGKARGGWANLNSPISGFPA
jgi:hypothetical protein